MEEQTVILDIGQGTTKVGYAGDEQPFAIFPTVTGTPKYKTMAGVAVQDIYVGDDTIRMRGVLKLDYPILRGNVMNWEQYYAILNHIFYNILRLQDLRNVNIVYIIPPLTPPDVAIYFARVLFETHQCHRVALVDSATSAVFSVGETTGLSIEIGCGLTHIVPVMNAQTYQPSIRRLNLAGIDVEEYLNALMTQYGLFQKREIIHDIKERVLKIAMDPTHESQDAANDIKYTLPDGETLKLNAYMRIMAGEILFNPILITMGAESLHHAIISSLKMVDPLYWRSLLKKIIISGGTSYIQGLKERLEAELQIIIPQLGEIPSEDKLKPSLDAKKDQTITPEKPEEVEKKLVQITVTTSQTEGNCPQCGEVVNPSIHKVCPNCGAHLENIAPAQIDIMGTKKLKYPQICPKCITLLDGQTAICPKCNHKLNPVIVSEELDRKEKKLVKKAAVNESELSKLASQVEDEYGTEESQSTVKPSQPIPSSPTLPSNSTQSTKLINVIMGDDRIYASFKGAAILASLPSFQKFMIDYQTFSADPKQVIVDFSKVVNI